MKPAMIAVMDNLGGHKGQRVRELFRKAGIKLFFLPLYAPDLNPNEEVFAKLKRLLRKANERTVEATWRRIRKLLNHFPPHECANYVRGVGYASTEVRKTLESARQSKHTRPMMSHWSNIF